MVCPGIDDVVLHLDPGHLAPVFTGDELVVFLRELLLSLCLLSALVLAS